jgi:hypothetical protein
MHRLAVLSIEHQIPEGIGEGDDPERAAPRHSLLLALLLALAFLVLYVRTAAPSVLSGDSAEFQLAAPLLGVPHPTTYPLYMLLGKLATLAILAGDLAWRVTLVSAICAALAVALFFLLARRVVASAPAALVGALALGHAPGLWNAATMAEVYALLMALLAALGYLLVSGERRAARGENRQANIIRSSAGPLIRSPIQWGRLRLAALVGGLGFTHHGLFAIVGLPLLAGYVFWLIARRPRQFLRMSPKGDSMLRQMALLALCFGAGTLPWLYPLAQFARYGPFTGMDYGLPRHYFWGAPTSWGQLPDLLTGGQLRQGIFRAPTLDSVAVVLRMVGMRLLFEFGPVGVSLGLLGSVVLLRRARAAWIGTAWMFFATLGYLLLLGPAVQDALVFTLPMLLPWALWITAAVEFILSMSRLQTGDKETRRQRAHIHEARGGWLSSHLNVSTAVGGRWPAVVLALLVAMTLAWGYTRLHVSSKRQLWSFRRFGEATLAQLPRGAAVITHWEQGMTLQYLILVEGRRPDVWVDVVEPGNEDWGTRARRRYADRPVFFVGAVPDVAGLSVDLVRADSYANLFVLRK